jgi:hypothetical protein
VKKKGNKIVNVLFDIRGKNTKKIRKLTKEFLHTLPKEILSI